MVDRTATFNGARLRELRLGAGLRREDLAVTLRCSARSVANWETGLSRPRVDDAGLIAHALSVGVEELYAEPVEATA
jgi:transcriptional regulator with XRE-family HTH domain